MRLKNCSLAVGLLAVWLLAFSAYAMDTVSLLDEGPAKQLLEGKKPICAETSGEVPVPFDQALAVFAQSNLLGRVQQEYCELLTDDGKPEFAINQTSTNTYFYVNREGERTDITEVLRRQTGGDTFDIVLYSAGKRFFGHYEAVIHVQLARSAEGATDYTAVVYAYPENAFSRFFARHLNLVERYFAKKTNQMAGIVTTISCSLCAKAS